MYVSCHVIYLWNEWIFNLKAGLNSHKENDCTTNTKYANI